ncbi:MAG: site-specific DNA-methyltransferase [Minisyncoccales bacterium]
MEVKTNEIYQLGDHKLACGNVNNKKLLNRLIGRKKIDCIVCDPPYGVSYVESKSSLGHKLSCKKEILNDQYQSDDEYKEFSKEWLENIKPYLSKKNSFYIFNSDKMIFSLRVAIIDSGYKFAQMLIWVKSHSVIGRMDYLPQHELIAYGWYGSHKFKRSKDKSVLFYPKPNKNKLHSTMKPVGLLRNIILNSTNIDDYVFDGFGGSGSTIISCEHLKRKCLMVEIDIEHCKTIIKRWEKLTNKKAKKHETR